jgi:hypothetical protein
VTAVADPAARTDRDMSKKRGHRFSDFELELMALGVGLLIGGGFLLYLYLSG